MMGGAPPAGPVWKDAFGLLQLAANPDQVTAALQAIIDAQAGLDTKTEALNNYETKLSAREHAVAVREQAAKEQDAALLRKHDDIFLMQTELAAAKATHQAEMAKTLESLDARRKTIEAAEAVNKATANKLAATRDEMAKESVAVQAIRAGLIAREKAVEEAEGAFAAKRERLAKALQEA